MIRFENVRKVYGSNTVAIEDLNLIINKGELVVLIGPSGCGKTTTMKMINRLIPITSGNIYIDGKNTSEVDEIKLRRNIGYVIQQIGLFPHMTISENISVVPRLEKWEKEKYLQRVDELLELVGLDPEEYKNRFPKQLSGGQQQRIGVIRALAAEPPIILMDEPFGALDPITREQLQEELVKLQNTVNKTIVFVTHDIDEAIKIADRIAIMKDGEIVQLDTPDQILRNPKNEFVAEFVGQERLIKSSSDISLKDIMIDKPITIDPEKGLAEALGTMRKRKVDSLLVTKDGKLIGILTSNDIRDNIDKADKVNEAMTEDVISINTDQSASEAVSIIRRKDIGYLPIVTRDNTLKGLITRSSIVNVLDELI